MLKMKRYPNLVAPFSNFGGHFYPLLSQFIAMMRHLSLSHVLS